MNEKGMKLLKSFEGCKLKAYKDAAGVWTIGYGITTGAIKGVVVKAGMKINQNEAEKYLAQALQKYERAVEVRVKVLINENQKAALTSFCYNIGIGGFSSSSALKSLNLGDYDAVPAKMALWNQAGGKVLRGLVRRRAAEGELFLLPVSAAQPRAEPTPKAKMQPGKPAVKSITIWSALLGFATSAVTALAGMDWKVALPLIAISAVFAFWIIKERLDKSRMDGV